MSDKQLTGKQAAFAQLVANGARLTEAYREVYSSQGQPQTLRVSASRLAKTPNVATRIEELRAGTLDARLQNDVLRRQWVIERLRNEAVSKSNSASVRVRALELLGKSVGLFDRTTTVKVEHRTPEEIETELMVKLQSYLTVPDIEQN